MEDYDLTLLGAADTFRAAAADQLLAFTCCWPELPATVPLPQPGSVTPHIAQNISGRRSAVDARTTRHPGYAVSQQKRKRIEEPFGWGKTIGGLARPMLRGVKKLGFKFTLTMASYNLIRLPKLIEATA